MRVLTVGNRYPPAGTGGYERIWRAAVEGMRAAGHVVEVLTTVPDPRDEPPEPAAGVHRVLRWPWRPDGWERPGPVAAARQERGNVAAFTEASRAVDLVAWFSMGGLSLSLITRCQAPQLAVVHDGWPLYGPGVDPWTYAIAWSPAAGRPWPASPRRAGRHGSSAEPNGSFATGVLPKSAMR